MYMYVHGYIIFVLYVNICISIYMYINTHLHIYAYFNSRECFNTSKIIENRGF